MKYRNPREPSPYFILAIIVIVFCAVIALQAGATPPNNQAKRETPEEIRRNQHMISQITYCRVLALNMNMTKQAERYAVKLDKFDDFYHELKIFHAGQVTGFLNGILFQMGFTKPSKRLIKNLSQELYFRQCDISL